MSWLCRARGFSRRDEVRSPDIWERKVSGLPYRDCCPCDLDPDKWKKTTMTVMTVRCEWFNYLMLLCSSYYYYCQPPTILKPRPPFIFILLFSRTNLLWINRKVMSVITFYSSKGKICEAIIHECFRGQNLALFRQWANHTVILMREITSSD